MRPRLFGKGKEAQTSAAWGEAGKGSKAGSHGQESCIGTFLSFQTYAAISPHRGSFFPLSPSFGQFHYSMFIDSDFFFCSCNQLLILQSIFFPFQIIYFSSPYIPLCLFYIFVCHFIMLLLSSIFLNMQNKLIIVVSTSLSTNSILPANSGFISIDQLFSWPWSLASLHVCNLFMSNTVNFTYMTAGFCFIP